MAFLERQALIDGERAGSRYALAQPRTLTALVSGAQLGGRAGSSLEFRDHRDYQPGDDLRRIDWNVFARSDKLTVKLYREEISPHLDLVLDGSRSMALAESEKMRAAVGVAAALAVAAANAGFTHDVYLAGEWCAPVVNGKNRPSAWDGIKFDFRGNLGESLNRAPLKLRRQGMRALISDLLWLGEPLTALQRLAQSASALVVIQVLAQADLNPPERGRVRLVDSETDEQREILIDAAAISRYQLALKRHEENWRSACRQIGAVMVSLNAEKVVADWDLSELVRADILKV